MIVDTELSLLTFVYPFVFAAENSEDLAETVGKAVANIENATRLSRDGTSSSKVWEIKDVPTEDWLPHVANYLNVNAELESADPTIYLWTMANSYLTAANGLDAKHPLEMVLRRGAHEKAIAFTITEVDFILFQLGVAFVVVRLRPVSDDPAAWLDFQSFARFTTLKRGKAIRRQAGPNIDANAPCFHAMAGQAVDNQRPRLLPGEAVLDDLLQAILAAPLLDEGKKIPIRPIFLPGRMIPHSVIFLQESAGDAASLQREEFLYKVHRCFHSQQTYHPAAEDLPCQPPWFYPYAKDHWFHFSLEGGGFVGFNAPATEFFRTDLIDHLHKQYFLLFVIALQQRFVLMALSDDVARHWKPMRNRKDRTTLRPIFEDIRERLFDFTSRGYFVQVVQRDNHHRCYQHWQEKFQIAELYEEVCTEVREMSEYLTDLDNKHRERQVSNLAALLSVMIGAPALSLAFWSININGWTVDKDGLDLWCALACVAGTGLAIAAIFVAAWWLIRRR